MDFPYLTCGYIILQIITFITNCNAQNLSLNECIMPTTSSDYFTSVVPWTLGCDTNIQYSELWRYVTYPFFHYGIILVLMMDGFFITFKKQI